MGRDTDAFTSFNAGRGAVPTSRLVGTPYSPRSALKGTGSVEAPQPAFRAKGTGSAQSPPVPPTLVSKAYVGKRFTRMTSSVDVTTEAP